MAPGYGTAGSSSVNLEGASTTNVDNSSANPNMGIFTVNADAQLCFISDQRGDVLIDVTGFVAGVRPARTDNTATRILDTRKVPGTPGLAARQRVCAPSGATPGESVIANITQVGAMAPGYGTAGSSSVNLEGASTTNVDNSAANPNMGIFTVNADAQLCFISDRAGDVLIDVTGYVAGVRPARTDNTATRILDTRTTQTTMPATGRYSSHQYTLAQIDEQLGLQYGTAPNYLGQPQNLLLDLYAPPSTGVARPLIILVHGGGFRSGDRSNLASNARDYARRGFVAVSLGYRLNPTLRPVNRPSLISSAYIAAAKNAIDDGMESVRWLRNNAATYEIDANRIAMMGSSAGGGVSLGVAVTEDPTPGGPLAHVSPRIQAAVATGATLTLGLDEITLGETPIMMIHYETDSATGATTADVDATCDALWAISGTCDRVILPGSGHGSPLGGDGPWWTPEIGPFLWQHLNLS